jgi:hypothetical protein
VVFDQRLTVHATGEVITPTITATEKLLREQPGVERFKVTCSCGEQTIVHVRVEDALVPGATGSFTCGCGYRHWFNAGPALQEEQRP